MDDIPTGEYFMIESLTQIEQVKTPLDDYLKKFLDKPDFSDKHDLDSPILMLKADRLTALSSETVDNLTEQDYPRDIVEKIGSEEEAVIYQEAGLIPDIINGKDVLLNPNIDIDQKDVFGRTNLDRMEQGLAPLDKEGKPMELHHIGQNNNSPLAELTWKEHRGAGNDTVLHDKLKESEIDRSSFAKERAEHWKSRAEHIKTQES